MTKITNDSDNYSDVSNSQFWCDNEKCSPKSHAVATVISMAGETCQRVESRCVGLGSLGWVGVVRSGWESLG